MNKLLKSFHKGQKGFTLIELLVVVGILGAIAAVVVLNVGGFIGRGQCEGYCTEKHNMQTAIVAWGVDNPGTVFVSPVGTAYDGYLIGGTKYDWSLVTVGTDGALGGDAAGAPTGCSC